MELLRPYAFRIGDYAFWLLLISVLCFALERAVPWRKEQRALRAGIGQDVFWLIFHGRLLGIATWQISSWLSSRYPVPFYGQIKGAADAAKLIRDLPLLAQFGLLLVSKDFLDWCTHNLLHRVPFLWQFHKVHHSIEQLDFIGNFRFHWAEVTVYWFVTSLPIAALGVVDGRVWMAVAVFSTLIGHLNHSNLKISWGPFRYLFNSPMMHVWHHDRILVGSAGRNFGVVFSCWDWLFGTAGMPAGQPLRLGFDGLESFPTSLPGRFFWPLSALVRRRQSSNANKP